LGAEAIRIGPVEEPVPVRHDIWWGIFARVWPRKDVSWRAKKILGALVVLAEGRTGKVLATMDSIAAKASVCPTTASRGVKELSILEIINWDACVSGFSLVIQINHNPADTHFAPTVLSLDCPAYRTKVSPDDGSIPPILPPPNNPPLRQDLNTAAAETVLSQGGQGTRELSAESVGLVHDAMALSRSITAGQVLVAIEHHSFEDVRAGITEATRVMKTGKIRRSVWGLVLSVAKARAHEREVLANAKRLGLEFSEPATVVPQAPAKAELAPPAAPPTNEELQEQIALALAGGPAGRAIALAIRMGVRDGLIPRELVPAELLDEQRAKPAAGSVAKPSPRPVGGPSPDATPDYNPVFKPDEIEGSLLEVGPCARQDSNLQPSDSKSASLSSGITDTVAGAVSLGRCLPRFDKPESDPKPPRRRKRCGFEIRDSMRC
jgi:hypothetical protein